MFLKQKRDVKIKGQTVEGGNKQRDFISKEEASSPTVATETVMLTVLIEAQDNRYVAVINIPNAFIQTKIEDKKYMVAIRVRGDLVQELLDISPKVYKPYFTKYKKGGLIILI